MRSDSAGLVCILDPDRRPEQVEGATTDQDMAPPLPETTTENGCPELPPGFRFHPTDQEIVEYLLEKALNKGFDPVAIGEVDLNRNEPWDLPSKAKMGEKEWYFFCQKDRKYPTGTRTNRATESGYWKATGKDKEIYRGRKYLLVGMKKTLVFYRGRAPKGEKTNWVMHEYRLEGSSAYHGLPRAAKDAWVVCRVFHKNTAAGKKPPTAAVGGAGRADPLPARAATFEEDELSVSPPFQGSPRYDAVGGDFKPAVVLPPAATGSFYFPSAASLQDLQSYAVDNSVFSDGYPNNNYNNYYYHYLQSVHQGSPLSPSMAVSASQDTGLSTDRNTVDVSSVVSRHGPAGSSRPHGGDPECPSSARPPATYLQDNLWKY